MSLTPQMQQDINLGRGGSYSRSRDAIVHQIWDTRDFAATPTNYTFFRQQLGASWNGVNKTVNETNLEQSGQFPNGQTFLAKRMGIKWATAYDSTQTNAAAVAQACINVLQNSVFEISIRGRAFDFQVHGSQFTPAIAISSATSADIGNANYGQYVSSGIVSLGDAPIFIDQLVGFEVTQTFGSPIGTVDSVLDADLAILNADEAYLKVFLEGTLTRAK